jgi:hypothetical protein
MNERMNVQVNAHVSAHKPRRRESLEVRVGNVTAARVQQALRGTPYEWMLDLSAKEWPLQRQEQEGVAAEAAAGVAPAWTSTNPCRDLLQCLPREDDHMAVLVSA